MSVGLQVCITPGQDSAAAMPGATTISTEFMAEGMQRGPGTIKPWRLGPVAGCSVAVPVRRACEYRELLSTAN